MTTILCLASYFKGYRLLNAYKDLGCKVILVATANLQDKPWPREAIDDINFVHDMYDTEALLKGVSYLAREHAFDLVVPLEEYMVEVAATVRAHFGCTGLTETVARQVRDKFTMRQTARRAGVNVPDFELVLNHGRLAHFLESVEPPWLIKPRAEGGAVQIHKVATPDEFWQVVHSLGDDQSRHLVEAFVPGDVLHVDSVISQGRVVAATANQYGKPPFDVWHGGGVFMSRTMHPDDPLRPQLLEMNQQVITAMGLEAGVTHCEFIRSHATGKLYFLEIGARTAGANLDKLTLASIGVDLFPECARSELFRHLGRPYRLETRPDQSAGLLVCLSREERPDMHMCQAPEVVWTLQEDYHAGVLVASPSYDRVSELLEQFGRRLADEHLAVLPPAAKPA